MAQDQAHERTEEATPKRLQDSRKKGQIARSREFNSVAVLISAAVAAMAFGDNIIVQLKNVMYTSFILDRNDLAEGTLLSSHFLESTSAVLLSMGPFLAVVMLAAIFSSISIGGWIFSIGSLAVKIDRLDPIKGMGRVFSLKGLIELVKALVKFVLIASVAISIIWYTFDDYLGLAYEPVKQALQHMSSILLWSFIAVSSTLILIAAVDIPFQIWDHAKKLKMTRQEIKDEYKETDGSPDLKRKIRETQQAIAARRMMSDVPKADVIIINPTHYSVALKYDKERMVAPIVLAKGTDIIAMKIRTVAKTYDVPVISSPSLSRAIYYSTKIGHEIPSGLYMAVAKVLAFVFQLPRRSNNDIDDGFIMDDLPIPDDLKRD